MALGIQIRADPLRSLAAGGISGTYATIGTPFDFRMVLLMAQNFTDQPLTFSFDGITDHFVLPSNGQLIYDACTNRATNATGLYFSVGTQMYVKGSPSTGNVYITTLYPRQA